LNLTLSALKPSKLPDMDASDAAAVLDRARQGDSEAFRSLVENHSRSAFRLAFRMTGNEHDAEDVVQDSFLRAYRQLGRFESRAHFGTWLHRIVANCSVDLLRARRSRQDHNRADDLDAIAELPSTDTAGPERLARSAEIERSVAAALAELSPLERAAFTLRHYEGRSIAEIGKTLGLGTSATKHSVFRAVRKLRVALGPIRGES
jgi:RNA polymerase sigma-70 factor (ECF subfamily)